MEPLYTPMAKGISTMPITLSIATHPTIAGFVVLIFSDDFKKKVALTSFIIIARPI